MFEKINFRKILDISIIFLLFITIFKRGGFYKSDVLSVNLVITAIGITYFCITSIDRKKSIVNITSIFLFLLGIAYFLPILFKNFSDMSDSIFEMIRYFNLYIIYKIVNESNDKKIYQNGIVIVTLIECIIGIDGIGSRVFSNILKLFNTGYLEKDFTRISGTIQYANVFAILCAISLLILVFKLVKRENIYINATCLSFIFSVLLLTESRAVTILFVIFLVCYMISCVIKKRENLKKASIVIFFNLIIGVILTAIIYNFCMHSFSIYIVSIIAILGTLLVNYIFDKYSVNILRLVNIKICVSSFIILFLLYIVLALNIDTSIYISDNTNNIEVTRNIYHIDQGSINNIKFKVDENSSDSKYRIKLFEVLNDLEVIELREVGYFSTSTGVFDIDFMLDENAKYLKISIECEEGSITLNNMYVNGDKIKLNYLLIPSSVIYKIQDILNGSTSITDRYEFSKDAISIITSSVKNFIIGIGGEGFKNTYELYQTKKYISSEVHNSFLQIFVESGIIGFICITFGVIYTIIRSNNKENRLLILLFVIHLLIDLELSYFSMIYLFGVLLAMCDTKDNVKLKIKEARYNNIVVVPILLIIFIILFKSNIAYGINVSKNNSNDILKQKEIVKTLEKKVSLDSVDVSYRTNLNEGYDKYLKLLLNEYSIEKKYDLKDEIDYVVSSIKSNLDIMRRNSKYNKYVISNICNTYFDNFYYFTLIEYPLDNEIGYEKYLNFILSNLNELEKHKYNEVAMNEVKELYNDYYIKLKEKNKEINSIKIQEFINILEEKIKIFE